MIFMQPKLKPLVALTKADLTNKYLYKSLVKTSAILA